MVNENISPDWFLVIDEMSKKIIQNPEIAYPYKPMYKVTSYRYCGKPDEKTKVPGCFFGEFFSETYQQWFYFEIKHYELEFWLYDKEKEDIVPDTDINAMPEREYYPPAVYEAVEAIFKAHPEYSKIVEFNLEDFKNDDFLLTYK